MAIRRMPWLNEAGSGGNPSTWNLSPEDMWHNYFHSPTASSIVALRSKRGQPVLQECMVTTSPGRGRNAWTRRSGLPQAGQRRHAAPRPGRDAPSTQTLKRSVCDSSPEPAAAAPAGFAT